MARISGRLLTLKIDGTDYADQVSRAVVTSGEGESDFITFANAAAGGSRDYKLALTMAQDAAAGSLWSEIFDNVGDTVPYIIAPYGNEIATAAEPHFGGNAIISEPDGDFIGGEANASPTSVMTVEVEWSTTGRPAKITGA